MLRRTMLAVAGPSLASRAAVAGRQAPAADRTIDPGLRRFMAGRMGAPVVTLAAGHLSVAARIERAAREG